ncbi:MAG: serine/threonine protein kinase [Planctomycetes bacterium]|nr:serine/threonine protein kinase [Planctomycetota bacterium]
MLMELATHPDADDLHAYRHGKLDASAAAAIEEHLSACDTGCDVLERTDDSLIGRLRCMTDTVLADEVPAQLAAHPRYRVLRLLGRGGMGAVYLAEHLRMGRQVALKIIHPELLRHPAALARFQQEVRAAARLDHPNIVVSHDADQAGGLHFLVMEHVDGRNLADHLAKHGPLPVHEACDIIRQAALGLEHAHRLGMIHRDIKPHNLMLTANGQVKVLDFGLALLKEEGIDMNKQRAGETREGEAPAEPRTRGNRDAQTARQEPRPPDEARPAHPDHRLTHTGAVMGTVDYVAPEQARDPRRADGRADVYSLGCTLYQLIAGQVPFPGGDAADKLTRLAEREPIRLTKTRPDVPEGVAAVVARMLAKRPEDRYATPAAVAQALSPFCVAARSSFVRRAVVGLALLAVLTAAAVAASVVRIPLGDRELVIETDDPAIEVIVKGERIVRIVDPKTGKAYQLDRQDLSLSLAEDPDGLSVTLDGKTPIVLRRQGKRIATVRLEQRKSNATASKNKSLFISPQIVNFGKVQRGETPTKTVIARSSSVRILEVSKRSSAKFLTRLRLRPTRHGQYKRLRSIGKVCLRSLNV